jgi:ribA/ribD-fused uncharacterized protein
MHHYSTEWIKKHISQGERVDFLFFWGHSNPTNERVGRFLFSQWYPLSFQIGGQLYQTAEHWMMAEKARLFNDLETQNRILVAETPKMAKDLGRQVQHFDSRLWEEKSFDIVVAGNLAKFGQNLEAKHYLLDTGDKVLVEASPVDAIWGIGHAQDSSEARDPNKWRGLNLLGFALMEVRDHLRSGIVPG